MKIKASELDVKDIGSRVVTREPSGTTKSRILSGIAHKLIYAQLTADLKLSASYQLAILYFTDRSELTVASTDQVEIDPETGIITHVRQPGRTGLR